MKRIAIMSIYDLQNIGNRLQNYAAIKILSEYGEVKNIVSYYNNTESSFFCSPKAKLRKLIKMLADFKHRSLFKYIARLKRFCEFDKMINNTKQYGKNYKYEKLDKEYDYFFVGSDQIWNRWLFPTKAQIAFCGFAKSSKCVAFMPSICMNSVTEKQKIEFINYLKDYKALSCRENSGSVLLSSMLGRKVETLIDPTLLLSASEWSAVAQKPNFHKPECRYALVYFLGTRGENINSYISKVANRHHLKIVDLLDFGSDYYTCGPMEFIWLIENCNIMFTDSFHGSVFSYIFNKPFKVFTRSNIGDKMNSRLENLLTTLHITSAESIDYDKVGDDLFDVNYDKTFLKIEQGKVKQFLNEAFND